MRSISARELLAAGVITFSALSVPSEYIQNLSAQETQKEVVDVSTLNLENRITENGMNNLFANITDSIDLKSLPASIRWEEFDTSIVPPVNVRRKIEYPNGISDSVSYKKTDYISGDKQMNVYFLKWDLEKTIPDRDIKDAKNLLNSTLANLYSERNYRGEQKNIKPIHESLKYGMLENLSRSLKKLENTEMVKASREILDSLLSEKYKVDITETLIVDYRNIEGNKVFHHDPFNDILRFSIVGKEGNNPSAEFVISPSPARGSIINVNIKSSTGKFSYSHDIASGKLTSP